MFMIFSITYVVRFGKKIMFAYINIRRQHISLTYFSVYTCGSI